MRKILTEILILFTLSVHPVTANFIGNTLAFNPTLTTTGSTTYGSVSSDHIAMRERINNKTIENLTPLLFALSDALPLKEFMSLLFNNPKLVNGLHTLLKYPAVDIISFTNTAMNMYGGALKAINSANAYDVKPMLVAAIFERLADKGDIVGTKYFADLLKLKDELMDFANVISSRLQSNPETKLAIQYIRIFSRDTAKMITDEINKSNYSRDPEWAFLKTYLEILNDVILETDKVTPEASEKYEKIVQSLNGRNVLTEGTFIKVLNLMTAKSTDEFDKGYEEVIKELGGVFDPLGKDEAEYTTTPEEIFAEPDELAGRRSPLADWYN